MKTKCPFDILDQPAPEPPVKSDWTDWFDWFVIAIIVAILACALTGILEFCILQFDSDSEVARVIRREGVWIKFVEVAWSFWGIGMIIMGVGWLLSQPCCPGGSFSKEITVKINGDTYQGTVTKK